MDELTRQLGTLEAQANAGMKDFFDSLRKYSGKISDLAVENHQRSKPQMQVTSTGQGNTATEDPDLKPVQATNQAAKTQAQDPITVTRSGKSVQEVEEQRDQTARSKPKPPRLLTSDDDYENTSFEVDENEIERDEISQSGLENTNPPITPGIDREIYSFDQDNGVRADPNLTVGDAEAVLDLMSGMEGQTVPNGENLLITSNGQKLFETNAKGVITYSLNQRQANFERSPINNSLNQMKGNLSSFVQTQRRVKTDLNAGIKNAEAQATTATPSISPATSSNNPFERFDQAIEAGDIKRTSTVNSLSEQSQNQRQAESLVTLRDQLKDGGVLTDGKSTITSTTNSKGISNINLSEPGQKSVSLGTVSKTGIVKLGTQYTNQRTTTIDNLSQNGRVEGITQQQQSSQTQAVTNGKIPAKNKPQSQSNIQTNGSAVQSSHNSYGIQDIENLNKYYKSAEYKTSPLSPGEPSQVTPQQANQRFDAQKIELFKAAQTSTNGQNFQDFNDPFFQNFSTEAVTLTAQERADLPAANEISAAQAAANKALSSKQAADVNHQAPTLKP
jgi:hypothetical protein